MAVTRVDSSKATAIAANPPTATLAPKPTPKPTPSKTPTPPKSPNGTGAPTTTLVAAKTAPLLAAAKGALKTAQAQLKNSQLAVQSTQAQLNALAADKDSKTNSSQMLKLQALLKQERQIVQTDQQRVDGAQAQVDAYTWVSSGDQAQAAQQSSNSAYTAATKPLTGSGINLENGGTLTQAQFNRLTQGQQAAYISYIAALTKVQADAAVSNQAYAQLQLFASDPARYGSIASDAVDAVNNALKPLGLQVTGPDAIDPDTAQQNYTTASQQAAYWTNAVNTIDSAGPGSSTTASSATVDAKISPLLVNSQGALATAQAQLKYSQFTEQSTQAQLNSLAKEKPSKANTSLIFILQAKLKQEQLAVQTDQQGVNVAKAQIDVYTWILSGDQANAAQPSVNSVYATLKKSLTGSGINLQNGDTLTQAQYKNLTSDQQTAYLYYFAALAKVQVKAAASNLAHTELQLFASDPTKYGSIASDAVDAVNSALQPLGLQITGPEAINVDTAQQNYNKASQDANSANQALNTITPIIAELNANDSGLTASVIAPKLAAAQQVLARAQAQLNTDKGTVQSTQTRITALYTEMDQTGVNMGRLGELRMLQARLAKEQQAVQSDLPVVNAAQALVDGYITALAPQQQNNDQLNWNSAFANLTNSLAGSGINLKNGATLTEAQQNGLNATQKTDYDKYIGAIVKAQTDAVVSNQANAQLQLFASDKSKYGNIASDAINTVNSALQPLGFSITVPDPIDANTAQRNYNKASKDATYWTTVLTYSNAVVADDLAGASVAADEAQLAALRKKFGHLAGVDPDPQLQSDEAAWAQADSKVQQAQTNITNLQVQAQQGLQNELGVTLAQENLRDAEAGLKNAQANSLAGVANLPPGERRLALAEEQSALDSAKSSVTQAEQQLADAQKGDSQDVTQFTPQELQAAIAKVTANEGQTVDGLGVSDVMAYLGADFKVNQEKYLIQSKQIYLTPEEQQLARADPVTLAFIKAAGITIDSSDPSLAGQKNQLEKELASNAANNSSDALLYSLMKLGGVSITEQNGAISITVNGKKQINVNADPALAQAVQNRDPVLIMEALLASPTDLNFDDNTKNLMAATQTVRSNYVQTQVQQLMGGKNPTDEQEEQALQILTTNMNASFSLQERQALWQEAGLPYFNEKSLEAHYRQILNSQNMGVSDPNSSGTGADKIGEWLKGLLQNSNGAPEVADVILNSVEDSYNPTWNGYLNAGSPTPKGTNLYEALSMAVQFDPSRAQDVAKWLTTPGKNGISIIQDVSASDFFSVHNAIMDGFNTLSRTIYGQFQNNKSYTAQMFNSTYLPTMQDAINAQNYAYVNNALSNFDPQTDVQTFFSQFNGDKYINQTVKITSATQIRDIVGQALGLTPTDNNAALNQDYNKDWYATGSSQRETIDLITGWIQKEGGNNPTITALPMIYTEQGAGVQYGALFQVQAANGHSVLIDGSAAEQAIANNNGNAVSPNADINMQWHFSSIQDYQDNNQLSRDGTIYLPINSILPSGTNGPGYVSYEAHEWNWKDTINVVRDVAVTAAVTAVTIATAGADIPALAVFGAGLAGFGTYEYTTAGENALTLAQGDTLNDQPVSLVTPITGNYGNGGVTKQEWGDAGSDAMAASVNSFGLAAGAAFGTAASEIAAARTLPSLLGFMRATAKTIPELIEEDAVAGYEGLLIAPDNASPQVLSNAAEFNQGLFKNAAVTLPKLAVRAGTGAVSMTATQAVAQSAQYIAAGIKVAYQESQGQITSEQGQQEMSSAFDNMLFNIITAPIAGAVGGLAGNSIVPEFIANLGINTALTEGNEFTQGGIKQIKDNWAADLGSILMNTAIGTALHAHQNGSENSSDFSAPGSVTVEMFDEINLIGTSGVQYSPAQPDVADAVYREYDSQGNPVFSGNNRTIVANNGVILNPEYVVYDSEGEILSQSSNGRATGVDASSTTLVSGIQVNPNYVNAKSLWYDDFNYDPATRTVTMTLDGQPIMTGDPIIARMYRLSPGTPTNASDIQLPGAKWQGQHYLLNQGENGQFTIYPISAGGQHPPGEENSQQQQPAEVPSKPWSMTSPTWLPTGETVRPWSTENPTWMPEGQNIKPWSMENPTWKTASSEPQQQALTVGIPLGAEEGSLLTPKQTNQQQPLTVGIPLTAEEQQRPGEQDPESQLPEQQPAPGEQIVPAQAPQQDPILIPEQAESLRGTLTPEQRNALLNYLREGGLMPAQQAAQEQLDYIHRQNPRFLLSGGRPAQGQSGALQSLARFLGRVLESSPQSISDVFNLTIQPTQLYAGNVDPITYLRQINEISQNRPKGSRFTDGIGTDVGTNIRRILSDSPMPLYGLPQAARDIFFFERAGENTSLAQQRIYINANAGRALDLMGQVVSGMVDRPDLFPGVFGARITGPALNQLDRIVIFADSPVNQARVLQTLSTFSRDYFLPETIPMKAVASTPGVSSAFIPPSPVASQLDTILHQEQVNYRYLSSLGGVQASAIYLAYRDLPAENINPRVTAAMFAANVSQRLKQFGIDPNDPTRFDPALLPASTGVAPQEAQQRVLPPEVLAAFFPNPKKPKGTMQGSKWVDKVTNWVMEPAARSLPRFSVWASSKTTNPAAPQLYDEGTYGRLYQLIPEDVRALLPRPGTFAVDDFTRELFGIYGGLEQFLADVHAHQGDFKREIARALWPFISAGRSSLSRFVRFTGEYGLIVAGSIPYFCGVYYSSVKPQPLTMKNAWKLDRRDVKEYDEIYNSREYEKLPDGTKVPKTVMLANGTGVTTGQWYAGKLILSLTGFEFASKPGELARPVDQASTVRYLKMMLLKYLGYFHSIGEVTAEKELVRQGLGLEAWKISDPKFQAVLSYLQREKLKIFIILHNDSGLAGEHPGSGRPQAIKTAYENFQEVIDVFGQRDGNGELVYKDVVMVGAHLGVGIGRYVRGNDQLESVTYTSPKTGGPVTKVVPEQIAKMYTLMDKTAFNIDLSWSDVKELFADSPEMEKAFIEFALEFPDRIIDGSDTVKTVNAAHYTQALMVGYSTLVKIGLQDREALWKIARGNLERLIKDSGLSLNAYYDRELGGTAKGRARIAKMQARQTIMAQIRDDRRVKARVEFDKWMNIVEATYTPAPQINRGVHDALYKILPNAHQHPAARPPQQAGQIGPGTSGGYPNARIPLVGRGGTPGRLPYQGNPEAAERVLNTLKFVASGLGVATISELAGGFGPPKLQAELHPSNPIGGNLNATAYAFRAFTIVFNNLYGEKLRIDAEAISEEGHLTRESLDRYMSHMTSQSHVLGLDVVQLTLISAVTEQFWHNFNETASRDVDTFNTIVDNNSPKAKQAQQFAEIHGAIVRWGSGIDRILGAQGSSVNEMDTRAIPGSMSRAFALGTYLINDIIALHAFDGGLDVHSPADVSKLAATALFALGNLLKTGETGAAFTSGLAGRLVETTRLYQAWSVISGWVLTVGGGALTVSQALQVYNDIVTAEPHSRTVADAVATVLMAGYSYMYGQMNWIDTEKLRAEAMPHVRNYAWAAALVGGALILYEIIEALEKDLPGQFGTAKPAH